MSNKYEEKLEARRERLQARAERRASEAAAQRRRSDALVEHIPLGQPILVGHHSEKRHRRTLERSQDAMFRSVDLQSEAARLRRQADSVGRGGISSDDPDAIPKLRAKLERLEASREKMKTINRVFKRGGWDAVFAEGLIAEKQLGRLRASLESLGYKRPFPSYALSNAGSEIRRVRKRIEELEARATEPEGEPIAGDGFRIVEDREDNRIRIYFDAKPPEEVRQKLKRAGFRWARSVGAWQRHLSANALYYAKSITGAE